MSAGLQVTVTPDLDALTKKLLSQDAAGGRVIKNALAKRMRTIGDDLVAAERASIMGTTIRGVKGSSRGGAERIKRGGSKGQGKGIRRNIAGAIEKRNRMTGKDVGIEVRVSRGKMPSGMGKVPFNANLGHWRHPVFGDRKVWAGQNVTPALWWTRPIKHQSPKAQAAMLDAMREAERTFNAKFS